MFKSLPDARSMSDSEMDSKSEASVSTVREMVSELSMNSITSHDECFRSMHHSEGSFQKIEQYFMNGQLTDVVLVAGDRQIHAHRLVLSAASDYFAAMFTNDLKEASQMEISMQNVDGDALLALVHYCYNGKIELLEDTVETLLGTACLLQLTEVITACCDFLKKQLHPSNCIGIRLFADTQACKDLLEVAHNYTSDHFLEVIKNQEFLMLSADEVAKLLESDDLNVPSEEVIFNALLSWLEHDLLTRTSEIGRLLGFVRLPLLSPAFIVDHIESKPIFSANPQCMELIVEAFKYHLLPKKRNSLQSIRTRPRKSTMGTLYAVGGMDFNKGAVGIEKYDARCNTWTHIANMNGRRLQFGVAVIDGKLYVVGGRDGLKTLNTFECYDVKSNTWTPLPPMSTHRHGLGVEVLDGPLYAVGGHDGWSYLNTVERYDPGSRQWSYVAPMSAQRSTAGVAVLKGRLYAVGGRDGSSCLKSVECYDPHTNKWTMCASMTKRRGGVGVGVVDGFLYAIGGHDAPGLNLSATRFNCVERYDPQTDTWTIIASMSCGRDSVGVCMMGEKLFAVAGYDGVRYLKLVEVYDPQTNEWQEVAPLKNERAGAGLVVIANN